MQVRAPDESIRSNLCQYGLQNKYIDVIVADSSRPLWVKGFELDAIITDRNQDFQWCAYNTLMYSAFKYLILSFFPIAPYGIREPTERIGTNKVPQITEEQAATHIPSKIDYGHEHLYQDLLSFATQHLKVGGRLVTFVPLLRSVPWF